MTEGARTTENRGLNRISIGNRHKPVSNPQILKKKARGHLSQMHTTNYTGGKGDILRAKNSEPIEGGAEKNWA